MNIVRNLLFALLGLVVALGVVSCVYPVFMGATGSLDQAVRFRFFKSPDTEKPLKIDVAGFTVQEQSTDNQWVVIWHLNGKKSLSEIEYGRKYEGLNEIVPINLMKQGVQYRALVSGTRWPKPGLGEAGMTFFFSEGGKLVEGAISK